MPAEDQQERELLLSSLIASIPPGSVTSYGLLAKQIPGCSARSVARFLKQNGHHLPWHRVVSADGRIARHPGAQLQKERLEQEGIIFSASGRIPRHCFQLRVD